MTAAAPPVEVAPGVHRVSVPLPFPPREVAAWVIEGDDGHVLVDTGIDTPPARDALRDAAWEIGVTPQSLRHVVLTHAHIDHYGLAGRLKELTGAELAMHTLTDLDCEKYRHPDTARARRRDTYADHGVPEAERTDLADHLTRGLPYLHSVVEASRRLRGGEELVVGGNRWQVVHTPGHSLGHVRLWQPAGGVLLSGDHLLPAITPPVTFERGFDADPLRSYLVSLRTIAELRPRLVFPGHGSPFGDAVGRIDAIVRNKVRRLESIRRAIREQPSTVTELADRLVAKAVLAHQRQLAISETLAHIAYLRWSGLVERRIRPDGTYEWYATGDGPLGVDVLHAGA